MVGLNTPRSHRHDLVNLGKFGQPWLDFLQACSDPFQIAALQNELLFENVDQVLTLVARGCHDSQVQLLVELERLIILHQSRICLAKEV